MTIPLPSLCSFQPQFSFQALIRANSSYTKLLYKYPQKEFPYEDLIEENAKRTREEKEYQLIDTGVFDEDRYWDIFIESAKEADDEEELLFRVTAYNRGPEPADLHVVPHMWFRNTWSWGHEMPPQRPSIKMTGPMTAQSKVGGFLRFLLPSSANQETFSITSLGPGFCSSHRLLELGRAAKTFILN